MTTKSTPTFYWYDLETSGTQPKWDRIIQFAGRRTDEQLNPIDDGACFYVQLADDVLPNPDASLVTGLVPAQLTAEGVTEWEAMNRILEQFTVPRTCVAGYNSLRFDDEFVRYGLFRNLHDPYAREWQGGNRRWDIIDLARATGALRPEGISWPHDEDGLPVYKLEVLTAANGLEHGHAHDALSDVDATIGFARLLLEKQPKLFHYYLNICNKKAVRGLLEPFGERLCVHVSGMYPRQRYGTAPIVSIGRHPTNSNSIIVLDLSQDVDTLLRWDAQEITERLFTSGDHERPGLKELRINRAPFVAAANVLTSENQQRLGIDLNAIRSRWEQVRRESRRLQQKLHQVYGQRPPLAGSEDVDGSLYDGFLADADRSRSASLQSSLRSGEWHPMDFDDARLRELNVRLKARSFVGLLSADELSAWEEHIRCKLSAQDAPWLTLAGYHARLGELEASGSLTAPQAALIAQLKEHGARMTARYGMEGAASRSA